MKLFGFQFAAMFCVACSEGGEVTAVNDDHFRAELDVNTDGVDASGDGAFAHAHSYEELANGTGKVTDYTWAARVAFDWADEPENEPENEPPPQRVPREPVLVVLVGDTGFDDPETDRQVREVEATVN